MGLADGTGGSYDPAPDPEPTSPDGNDDNGGAPDSGAVFTDPDEVSGVGGYDGDAGGGVNEPADPEPSSPDPSPDDDSSAGAPTDGVSGNMGNRDGTTEDNRLAAYLSMMAGGDGGGQTGFGTTADEVLDTISSQPDRFQEAVAGAREQYAEFRENNPMSEVLEEYGGDALTDDDSSNGSSSDGLLAGYGRTTVLAAGAAAVGAVALAFGGD